MQTISEAVVDKVREEAQHLVNEAEEESKKELDKAKTQRAAHLEAEKKRLLTEANEEAARVTAQTAMKSRQMVANAKVAVLDAIVEKARGTLAKTKTTRESLTYLINDAIVGLGGSEKVSLLVSKKDVDMAKEIVKADKKLAAVVAGVSPCDCIGGVLAQNEGNTLCVDNTYTTRLGMLLPRVLPEISKKLF
jgi:vacuolar-type H+-ATPase subunit E/Vma4